MLHFFRQKSNVSVGQTAKIDKYLKCKNTITAQSSIYFLTKCAVCTDLLCLMEDAMTELKETWLFPLFPSRILKNILNTEQTSSCYFKL